MTPGAAEVLGADLATEFDRYLRVTSLSWPPLAPQRGTALVLWAASPAGGRARARARWSALLSGPVVHRDVDAGHDAMLRHPHAAVVAREIGEFLDATQAAAATGRSVCSDGEG